MGGIWLLIDAYSAKQIEQRFPKLTAYEDKPKWMSEEEKTEYFKSCKRNGFHWDIEDEPTGWLKSLDKGKD